MLFARLTKLTHACLMGMMAAVLSGCLLQTINGFTVVRETGSGATEIIAAVVGHDTVAVCGYDVFAYATQCTYVVQGQVMTSTIVLVSEFGLVGDVFDPVIVQVPVEAISVTATYSNAGTVLPAVTSIQPMFEYVPFQFISAEVGTKFIIMDIPPEV